MGILSIKEVPTGGERQAPNVQTHTHSHQPQEFIRTAAGARAKKGADKAADDVTGQVHTTAAATAAAAASWRGNRVHCQTLPVLRCLDVVNKQGLTGCTGREKKIKIQKSSRISKQQKIQTTRIQLIFPAKTFILLTASFKCLFSFLFFILLYLLVLSGLFLLHTTGTLKK